MILGETEKCPYLSTGVQCAVLHINPCVLCSLKIISLSYFLPLVRRDSFVICCWWFLFALGGGKELKGKKCVHLCVYWDYSVPEMLLLLRSPWASMVVDWEGRFEEDEKWKRKLMKKLSMGLYGTSKRKIFRGWWQNVAGGWRLGSSPLSSSQPPHLPRTIPNPRSSGSGSIREPQAWLRHHYFLKIAASRGSTLFLDNSVWQSRPRKPGWKKS